MKLQRLYVVLLVATIMIPAIGFTQPPPPPPPKDTATEIPFDGGLSLILLAAGAGYAAKKGRERKQKKEVKD